MKKIFSTLLLVAFLMPLTVWAATDAEKQQNFDVASKAYKKAQNSQKISDYENALRKLNNFLILNEGKPIGNTSEMMEDCKLHIYKNAVSLYNKAKSDTKTLKTAKDKFDNLSEYEFKNAKAYADSCAKFLVGGANKVKLSNNSKSISFDNTGKSSETLVFEKISNISEMVKDLKIKTPDWLNYKIEENGAITLTAKQNQTPKQREAFVMISGEINTAKNNSDPVMSGFITYCKVSQASNETVFLPVIKLTSTTKGVGTTYQAIQCNDNWDVSQNPTWVEAYKEGDALKLAYEASETKRSGDLVIKTKTDGKEIKFRIVQEEYVPQPIVDEPKEPVVPQPVEDLDAKIAKVNSSSVSDYSFGTTQVSTDQVKELIDLYEVLKKDENATVTIYGNTCSIGSEKANEKVGLERAESAKAFLVNLGIAPERISAVSNGESAPVADNSTAEGRAKNRRLTFDVKK